MTMLLRNRGAMLLLMVNIFIAFAGIGLVIPVMPAYMDELGMSGSTVGFLTAAFSLTQLLCSPYAGKLADTIGRKRIMIFGLVVFAVSELLFALANGALLLYVSRLMGGIGAALLTPAIMAYVADMTSDEERAQGMGFIGAAISTGFIIGPGIGGMLAEIGLRVPFFSAAGAAAVAAFFTIIVLPETLTAEKREELKQSGAKTKGLMDQLVQSLSAPYFYGLLILLVLGFGLANFETVFGLFLDRQHQFTPGDIALIITISAILGVIVQVAALAPLLRIFGERRVIYACLLVTGVAISFMLFVNQYWSIMVVTFIVFLATDIMRPAAGTMLSKLAGEDQGFVAGLNSSYTSMGNIAGAAIAGILFDIHAFVPYAFASFVLLMCYVVSVRWFQGKQRRGETVAG